MTTRTRGSSPFDSRLQTPGRVAVYEAPTFARRRDRTAGDAFDDARVTWRRLVTDFAAPGPAEWDTVEFE
jgi:hypothetical protein